MPQEQLNIPETPPISADYDSFLADVTKGAIRSQADLINKTQRVAPNGRVRDGSGQFLFVNRETGRERYGTGEYYNEEFAIERREVTSEQAEVIGKVLATRLEAEKINQQLRDTESFLNDVFAGSLKSKKDFDNRTQRVAPNGRVRDGSGQFLFVNRETGRERYGTGEYLSEEFAIERRSISSDQQKLIGNILERKLSFTSTDKGLRDTGSFIQDLVAQKLSAADLENRLLRRGPNGRVRDGSGQFLFVNRETGRERYGTGEYYNEEFAIERREVTTEQVEVIRSIVASAESRAQKIADRNSDTLAATVLSGNLSVDKVRTLAQEKSLSPDSVQELLRLTTLNGLTTPDVRTALREFLNTNNDSAVRQLVGEQRAKLADVSNNEIIDKDLQNTEDLVQTVRRINIRSNFWKAVNDLESTVTPNEILAAYRINDEADKQLISELRTEASKVARDNGIVELFTLLGKSDRDFDAINNVLKTTSAIDLLVNKQPSKALEFIAKSAYDLEIKSFFQDLTNSLSIDKQSIDQARDRLQNAPIRASLSGGDFFGKFQAAKEDFIAITDQLEDFAFEKETAELRKRFLNDPDVMGLINEIQSIPGASEELNTLRQSLLDELALTVTVRRGQDPTRFAMLKTIQLEGIRASEATGKAELDRTSTDPERTAEAVKGLVERYQRSIMPLFETLRGTEAGKAMVEDYVSGRTGDRARYIQRIEELEKQRGLTDIERAYLESVQLLTVFNPQIVALVKEAPELTSLYLEQYFTSRSDNLRERVESTPDVYFPIVQIGLGPNGVAAAGELARSNPEAAKNALYVDKQQMPGGPFAVARGLAWELNSASSNAESTNNLPTPIKTDQEGLSVRSYGSPLVAFPGERQEGFDLRQASINVTVDYLPNPDNISTKRYPTNLDLSRITQLQTAMITENVLLSSELVGIEKVEDDGQPGNKRLRFEYTTDGGEIKEFTVRTDYVNLPGGLGEPNYGIRLEGSEAQKILEGQNIAADGFPVLTDTLGAFDILSNPEGKPIAPKGTIVIPGRGNSTDVLIEFFGRLFESGNPALNGISNIVIVADGELSRRFRYAGINDLKARNGQPNFISSVKARASDYVEKEDGRVEIIDQKTGKPINAEINGKRGVLRADHVITGTGFSPKLDALFKSFLAEDESINKRAGLARVTLPNNPGFSIANTLQNDPNVLFVGTASDADFQNSNKLAQLPDLAREALVRNGAENAVAIGFRTPDTRAAIRLKYEGLEVQKSTLPEKQRFVTADVDAPVSNTTIIPFAENIPEVRRNVDPDTETLTALFLDALPDVRLGRGSELLNPSAPEATRTYNFNIATSYDNGAEVLKDFGLVITGEAPSSLKEAVANALADPYFQAYAKKALRQRRTSRGLEVSLGFKRGRLVFRDQGENAPSRTYVEAQ